MTHLHTVNKPVLLDLCLRSIEDGDALLLIEDGVYGAQQYCVEQIPVGISIYVLRQDLEARGLVTRIDERVVMAEIKDFVSLCCHHDKIINWF